MDTRAEYLRLQRIADIEGGERLINERLLQGADDRSQVRIRCECGDDGCHEPLTLSREVYEKVRADPMLFVLREGHVMHEAEDVVESGDGWEIVKKHENMRDVVEASDPRR